MVSITKMNSMTRNVTFGLALTAVTLLSVAVSANAEEKDGLGKTERLLVKAQQICPVMGKDLTKMGGPLKAKVGEETVFLCCKGCFKGKIQKEHWEQIQANLIAAQGKCPVMDKPLPKNPTSTVVEGRRVFVCCPPCTKKVQADPEKYLARVDRLLEENLGRTDRER